MLTLAYIALAVLGCGYILVSVFLGHLFDFGSSHGDGAGGHDGGGHDAGHDGGDAHYGVSAGGHGKVAHADTTTVSFSFPFFSPLALSTLFASIGGFGLMTKLGMGMTDIGSMVASVPLAFVVAYVVTFTGWKIVKGSVGTSQINMVNVVGATAEVITPIPVGGLGEVAAVVQGSRFTGSARSEDGSAITRGATVTVKEIVGSTLVVSARAPKGA